MLLLTISSVIVERFFFQAEDGIRDTSVTGVQTCALPISLADAFEALVGAIYLDSDLAAARKFILEQAAAEIGRASCRETVYSEVGAATVPRNGDYKSNEALVRGNHRSHNTGNMASTDTTK